MAFTVRQARRFKDVTMAEMAKHLSISKDTYIKLERNPEKFTISQANLLCDYLGFNKDDVIFCSESEPKVE